jgi:hypothetical protein
VISNHLARKTLLDADDIISFDITFSNHRTNGGPRRIGASVDSSDNSTGATSNKTTDGLVAGQTFSQ